MKKKLGTALSRNVRRTRNLVEQLEALRAVLVECPHCHGRGTQDVAETAQCDTCYGEGMVAASGLLEQLETERRANTGLSADITRFGEALTEILERPHGEIDEHDMRSIAHAALNPASTPDASKEGGFDA